MSSYQAREICYKVIMVMTILAPLATCVVFGIPVPY